MSTAYQKEELHNLSNQALLARLRQQLRCYRDERSRSLKQDTYRYIQLVYSECASRGLSDQVTLARKEVLGGTS